MPQLFQTRTVLLRRIGLSHLRLFFVCSPDLCCHSSSTTKVDHFSNGCDSPSFACMDSWYAIPDRLGAAVELHKSLRYLLLTEGFVNTIGLLSINMIADDGIDLIMHPFVFSFTAAIGPRAQLRRQEVKWSREPDAAIYRLAGEQYEAQQRLVWESRREGRERKCRTLTLMKITMELHSKTLIMDAAFLDCSELKRARAWYWLRVVAIGGRGRRRHEQSSSCASALWLTPPFRLLTRATLPRTYSITADVFALVDPVSCDGTCMNESFVEIMIWAVLIMPARSLPDIRASVVAMA